MLTSVFQASGNLCCAPLGINSGWNVFDAGHRRYFEELIEKKNRYLVTITFPCGPWNPRQRLSMANDEAIWERVRESRRQWLQIFQLICKIAKTEHDKSGKTMLENLWPSEAWATSEMEQALDLGMTAIKDVMSMDQDALKLDATPLRGGIQQTSSTRSATRSTGSNVLYFAFFNKEVIEDAEETHDGEALDAIRTSADLGHSTKASIEETVEHEEMLEQLEKEAGPEHEKTRKEEWRNSRKLSAWRFADCII
eukprot:s980_g13.t1